MTASADTSTDAGIGAPALGYHDGMTIPAEARTELLDIVQRSHRLGFCRWRVATALRASPAELALIDEQTTAESNRDHQDLIHRGQRVSGLYGLGAADPR